MLWVRKDLEAEQVAVESSELTAAVLRLPDRAVLVVSVYVPGNDAEALLRDRWAPQAHDQRRTE